MRLLDECGLDRAGGNFECTVGLSREQHEGVEVESREDDVWRLRFDRRAVSAEVVIRRVADRYCVSDLSIEEPELESIIRRIYLEGYSDVPPDEAGAPAASTAPA